MKQSDRGSHNVGGRPGGNPGAHLKSISHRCHLREVEFEWELTKDTIYLPLACLQGGVGGGRRDDGDEFRRQLVGDWLRSFHPDRYVLDPLRRPSA